MAKRLAFATDAFFALIPTRRNARIIANGGGTRRIAPANRCHRNRRIFCATSCGLKATVPYRHFLNRFIAVRALVWFVACIGDQLFPILPVPPNRLGRTCCLVVTIELGRLARNLRSVALRRNTSLPNVDTSRVAYDDLAGECRRPRVALLRQRLSEATKARSFNDYRALAGHRVMETSASLDQHRFRTSGPAAPAVLRANAARAPHAPKQTNKKSER